MAQADVVAVMADLVAAYRENVSEDTVALYCRKLAHLEPELMQAAVGELIRESKHFPRISEIVDQCNSLAARRQAQRPLLFEHREPDRIQIEMIGKIPDTAIEINRLCDEAGCDQARRMDLHRIHGEILARGGGVDDVLAVVKSELASDKAQRTAAQAVGQ